MPSGNRRRYVDTALAMLGGLRRWDDLGRSSHRTWWRWQLGGRGGRAVRWGWCGWGGGAQPVQQDPRQGHEGDRAEGTEDRVLAVDANPGGGGDSPAQRPQQRHGRGP